MAILQAKVPYQNFIFFLNITAVIDNIIIKKGINYLLSDGKSTAKSVYYLHSRSVNDRRHSLKLTLKFRYRTFPFYLSTADHLLLSKCFVYTPPDTLCFLLTTYHHHAIILVILRLIFHFIRMSVS